MHNKDATPAAGAEEGGTAVRRPEPNWNQYAPGIRRLFYPAFGKDGETIAWYLDRFPDIKDVYLEDKIKDVEDGKNLSVVTVEKIGPELMKSGFSFTWGVIQ